MMFLFGGIPDIYFEKLRARAIIELEGHHFTGLPLRATPNGSYLVNQSHCRDLIETLIRYMTGRPNCIDDGLVVLMLLRPWEPGGFAHNFYPFAFYREIRTIDRPARAGQERLRVANVQTDDLLKMGRSLTTPVKAIKRELQDRLKRSPILLPLHHFSSPALRTLLDEILANLHGEINPGKFIRERCEQFEQEHPFVKVGGRTGRFTDRRGIFFDLPGRALHGEKSSILGHPNECYLSAKLRIGGPFDDGFHFDCTRGGGAYAGSFANCHGAVDTYRGNPHLNVYPNDFIR
jgi:hypothetical protein